MITSGTLNGKLEKIQSVHMILVIHLGDITIFEYNYAYQFTIYLFNEKDSCEIPSIKDIST